MERACVIHITREPPERCTRAATRPSVEMAWSPKTDQEENGEWRLHGAAISNWYWSDRARVRAVVRKPLI
jgi:hypothetical protein